MVKVTKFLRVGLGGRKCVCCFPSPGSNAMKLEYRIAKRRSDREASKEINVEIIREP